MNNTYTTASVLKAVLCFIDPEKTPKIAFDDDAYTIPLIEKIKHCLGDLDGSQQAIIRFSSDEGELMRQFNGVCHNIKSVFADIERFTKTK